jgi:putative phosphoesterase
VRIAVLADSHNRLPAPVLEAVRAADEIWHLGDVIGEAIIITLEKLGPPVRVVRGNCDACLDWPLTLDFTLAGRRFHLEHIPTRTAPPRTEFFLHGHTHVPRDEMDGGVRYLNPGSVGRANKGAPASYAWLTLEENHAVTWKIVLV